MKHVAIIGAGPAGLVAAKEFLEQGFDVTVFEKSPKIGGLWNVDTGHVWQGMKANLSRDTCRFPDFDYKRPVDIFPNHKDIVDYLIDYVYAFKLLERATFNFFHTVTNVSRSCNAWSLQAQCEESDDIKNYHFDSVVVSSGFFSKPRSLDFLGQEKFFGVIEHSAHIQNFEHYEGEKVMVIGAGFSGCDICVGLTKAGASVEHVMRRPYWLLPRHVKTKDNMNPIDRAFYQYPEGETLEPLSPQEAYREANQRLGVLCKRQVEMQNGLQKNPDSTMPPLVAITDGYLDLVEAGVIKLSIRDVVNLETVHANYVIAATGYETNLSFLEDSVLKTLQYDPTDQFMPIVIGPSGQHPEINGLHFVGMFKGPYFLTMALQAQIAAKTMNSEIVLRPEYLKSDLQKALDISNQEPRSQFPYDYIGSSIEFAEILGIKLPTQGFIHPQHFKV